MTPETDSTARSKQPVEFLVESTSMHGGALGVGVGIEALKLGRAVVRSPEEQAPKRRRKRKPRKRPGVAPKRDDVAVLNDFAECGATLGQLAKRYGVSDGRAGELVRRAEKNLGIKRAGRLVDGVPVPPKERVQAVYASCETIEQLVERTRLACWTVRRICRSLGLVVPPSCRGPRTRRQLLAELEQRYQQLRAQLGHHPSSAEVQRADKRLDALMLKLYGGIKGYRHASGITFVGAKTRARVARGRDLDRR